MCYVFAMNYVICHELCFDYELCWRTFDLDFNKLNDVEAIVPLWWIKEVDLDFNKLNDVEAIIAILTGAVCINSDFILFEIYVKSVTSCFK